MDRLTPDERVDALAIIRAESDRGVGLEAAEAFLQGVIGRAVRLHRLYETACNRDLNKREAREVEEIEAVLRDDFKAHADRIENLIQRLLDKLDGKADKRVAAWTT